MLPFQPETVERMIGRFPQALEKTWLVTDPMPDRPGLHREHVFDFPSGMRLLISRDRLLPVEPAKIHVSASWEFMEPRSIDEMNRRVKVGYELLGGKGKLSWVGFSQMAIPHWVVETEH